LEYFSITNTTPSYGAAYPEKIDQLKVNSKGNIFSQYRNVSNTDYKSYLQLHPDIIKGNAWG
jgi:hypothetical protein